jgi:hypothetical protein
MNKSIDSEELDLEKLENVSGGGIYDQFKAIAQQTYSKECVSDINDIKERLDRIENKLKITKNN